MVLEMPPELVQRARMLAQGGPWEPPESQDAATIVLLRDGAAGLEVLLMRRPDSMAFAPGHARVPRRPGRPGPGLPAHGPGHGAGRGLDRPGPGARADRRRDPRDLRGGRGPAGRRPVRAPRGPRRQLGARPAGQRDRRRVPRRSCAGAGCTSRPTCWSRSRTGSPPRSRPADSTPASWPPPSPRARTSTRTSPRPTPPTGWPRLTRWPSTARGALAMLPPDRRRAGRPRRAALGR